MQLLRRIKNIFNYYYFLLNGKKPWTRRYYLYKRRLIIDTIVKGTFNLRELKKGYGFRLDERIVE